MTGLSLSLLILASLSVINADSYCTKEDVANQLRSLREGHKVRAGFELVRDFFKTSPFPTIGYLDPLYIVTYRFQVDDDNLKAAADISATTIKGLLGFEVRDVKISLNPERIQLNFLFPEISASGKYDILPTSQQDVIFGNGEFNWTVTNLGVQINCDIGKNSDGEMFVAQMKSQLSFEEADVQVTGLFDDELASAEASLRLTELLPEYVPYMQDAFDEFLEAYPESVNTKLKFAEFLKSKP